MMSDEELKAALAESLSDALGDEFELADTVLSALRASGRLAPVVEGDVVEEAVDAWAKGCVEEPNKELLRSIIRTAAPIIAVATEARVREECATTCDALAKEFAVYRDHWPQRDGCNECAERIRTRPTRWRRPTRRHERFTLRGSAPVNPTQ